MKKGVDLVGLSVYCVVYHTVSLFNCGASLRCQLCLLVPSPDTSTWHVRGTALRFHWGGDCGCLATKGWWGVGGIAHSLQNLRSVVLLSNPLSISSLGGTWHPQILRLSGDSEARTGMFLVNSSSRTSFPFPPWVSISKILWLSVICCHPLFSFLCFCRFMFSFSFNFLEGFGKGKANLCV